MPRKPEPTDRAIVHWATKNYQDSIEMTSEEVEIDATFAEAAQIAVAAVELKVAVNTAIDVVGR